MGEVKITVKVGELEFSGEGDQSWIEKQLDKILNKAEELIQLVPPPPPNTTGPPSNHKPPIGDNKEIAGKALGSFLSEKGATTNQIKKFLATVVWLNAKGKNRVKIRDVTAAIKSNSQSRLGNPSRCLKHNVQKGYCEKDGNEFYVTDEGKKLL
jgi:hypothetical protein